MDWLTFEGVNWLAVAIAFIVSFAFGWWYYSPAGVWKVWKRAAKVTDDDVGAGNMGVAFGGTIAAYLLGVIVLAMLMAALDADAWLDGLVLGATYITLTGVLKNQGKAWWSGGRIRPNTDCGFCAPEFRNEGNLLIATSSVNLDTWLRNMSGGTVVHSAGVLVIGEDALGEAGLISNDGTYEQRRGSMTLLPDAVEAIGVHTWPGNVRELENVLKRAVIMADGSGLTAADLGLAPVDSEAAPLNLRQVREEAERRAVLRVLGKVNGNLSKAAELLGVSQPTLYDLMDRFGLK